jgi:hypothetical protein
MDMTYIFWFSTLVPGFAVAQAFFRTDSRNGLLAILSWAFVLTVALITPIVIVAFLFNLKMQTVAYVYIAYLVLGVIGIVRYTQWQTISRLFRIFYWPELIVVLLVVVASSLIPIDAKYDYLMHTAKIVYLHDAGFNLQDPYSPIEVIESKFHVNTLHSILAIGAWLTGQIPLEFVSHSNWFFKLLAFGALEYLAFSVFRDRSVGTLTIIGAMWLVIFKDFFPVPQAIGAYIFLPILLAQLAGGIHTLRSADYMRLAITSLALAATHVGFWVIVMLCTLPVLLGFGIQYWRNGLTWKPLIYAGSAMLIGFPFLIITAIQPNYILEQMGNTFLWEIKTVSITDRWNLNMVPPMRFPWIFAVLVATLMLMYFKRLRRARFAVVAWVFIVAFLLMYNPLFYEILMRFIPYWIITRMMHIGEITGFLVMAYMVAWVQRRTMPTRSGRFTFAVVFLAAGLAVSYNFVFKYFKSAERRENTLTQAVELREALRPYLSGRALIVADVETSMLLPAIFPAAVMAPCMGNANPADRDVVKRFNDARVFLDSTTTTSSRREIADSYGIEYVLVQTAWLTPKPLCEYRHDSDFDPRELADLIVEGEWFRFYKIRN